MIIYKATNLVNSKIYIGQTVNSLKYRQEQHWREANCKVRKNVHFHNALLKYSLDKFSFEIIDEASTIQEMNEKEQFWIAHYHSTNSSYGYNKDSGGKSGGFKSKDTKMKIGITTKEKWSKPESAQKCEKGWQKELKAGGVFVNLEGSNSYALTVAKRNGCLHGRHEAKGPVLKLVYNNMAGLLTTLSKQAK